MFAYYEAYYRDKLGEDVSELLEKAEKMSPDYCFPNKLEDIPVLRFAVNKGCVAKAGYYLGNLFYDKLQWEEALALWEASAKADDTFPTTFRNLSLVYYNKCKEPGKAKEAMETAFVGLILRKSRKTPNWVDKFLNILIWEHWEKAIR